MPRMRPLLTLAVLCSGLALLPGCVTQDDARVQQLLNQRGFGTRFSGDTNEQYYLGIGDQIQVLDPGHQELNNSYVVRPDGVIDVPMIDEIHVAGLTLPDVAELLTRRFREYITSAQVDVQLTGSRSKFFYVHGQVARPGRRQFLGDENLFKVVFDSSPTILADEDDVRLIRSDPINPLVVSFDYDDMAVGGWSGPNVTVREDDIIYVPPNLLGHLALVLQAALAPFQQVFTAVFQASRLIVLTETFGESRFGRRGGNDNRFGGFGFGGFYGDSDLLPATLVAPSDAGPSRAEVSDGTR